MRERSSGERIHGVYTLKEIPNHLNVGIFMFYVDAATVIEFGTRYYRFQKNLALLLSFIYRHWSHDMGVQ